VNKANKLIGVIPKYSARCYNHRSVSQLGYRHLSPVTPLPLPRVRLHLLSQVLSKGPVVRVFWFVVEALNPGSAPVPTNGSIVGT
jgi:hypothetical protein